MSNWEQNKWIAATFVSLLSIGLITNLPGQEPQQQPPGPGPLVVTGQAVVDAGLRLQEAELSLAEDAAGRVAVLQKTVDIVREFEAVYQSTVNSGERSQLELQRVRYERLTIEIELLKAKKQL